MEDLDENEQVLSDTENIGQEVGQLTSKLIATCDNQPFLVIKAALLLARDHILVLENQENSKSPD